MMMGSWFPTEGRIELFGRDIHGKDKMDRKVYIKKFYWI